MIRHSGEQSDLHLKLVDEKDPSIEFVDKGEHFHLYLETDDASNLQGICLATFELIVYRTSNRSVINKCQEAD